MTTTDYTVRGTILLDPEWPTEGIGLALMDCAHAGDAPIDFAVSIVGQRGEVEIECIVDGQDEADALTNPKIAIQHICACAELPVKFVNDQKPCPSTWYVEPSVPQMLALA